MNRFTEGKWENVIDHSRDAGCYPKTEITCNGKLIAECYKRKWTIDKDEAEANAKLIATAPEMLELLNHIIHNGGLIKLVSENPKSLLSDLVADIQRLIYKITEE